MKNENFNPVQRNYKDTLFRMIFSDKEALLSLYNAMSGKDYDDPDELEIVTLENAIYMNKKNDLAFVIDSSLNFMNINQRILRICQCEIYFTYQEN